MTLFTQLSLIRVATIQCLRDRVISHLQLLQGEPPSGTNATVVLERRASDDGPQHINRPRRNGSDLGKTSISATVLAARLCIPNRQLPIPQKKKTPKKEAVD